MKYRRSEIIKVAKLIHENKYDYSLVTDIKTKKDKIKIICPDHGIFEQTYYHHIDRKQKCKKCTAIATNKKNRRTLEEFITKSNKKHDNKYDYSNVKYINDKTKVTIICPIHGEFYQTPNAHLNAGKGCKYCGGTTKMDTKLFISKLKEIYGDKYSYDKTEYTTQRNTVIISCPKHGDIEVNANNLLYKKRGCVRCNDRIFDTRSLIEFCEDKYGDLITIDSESKYGGKYSDIVVTCKEHGRITVTPNYLINYNHCKKCANSTSKEEDELYDFIKNDLGIDTVIRNSRTYLNNGKELDIYLPDFNLAIEYCGIYWHSNQFVDKNYHLDKLNQANMNNIRLITIFSDEWLNKKSLVKSRITNILGLNQIKIYGRHTEIREITHKLKKQFLDENHIQGDSRSKINLGLYHNNELVSVMTFGCRPIFNNSEFELIRFCNKKNTSVIGGASKLYNYFVKKHNPKEVISYCDLRWNTGLLYEKLGLSKIKQSKPNYFYISNTTKLRENRIKYQKHKLDKLLNKFDPSLTEINNMINNGFNLIYDCGNLVFKIKY